MKLHLTRNGQRMFGHNENKIPLHWYALNEKQKDILVDLHNKKDVSANNHWDESALQLLIDIGLAKFS